MKNLRHLAVVLWIAGCTVTTKRPVEYPTEPVEMEDGSAMLVLTPEQWTECVTGGGCVTIPLDHVDPGCFFDDGGGDLSDI